MDDTDFIETHMSHFTLMAYPHEGKLWTTPFHDEDDYSFDEWPKSLTLGIYTYEPTEFIDLTANPKDGYIAAVYTCRLDEGVEQCQ
jgi:hypothetical protein